MTMTISIACDDIVAHVEAWRRGPSADVEVGGHDARWLSEHDRQVAERAWYKGHSTGIFDKQYETGTRNPYTRKEQS